MFYNLCKTELHISQEWYRNLKKMDYQWGSLPSGTKKERRGKRAELPDDVGKNGTAKVVK